MGLLGVFSLFCILLFIGAIVHSRCTLIIFSVCGLFSIILLWLLASIYVTSAVALADFCYKPTPWVQIALNHSFNLTDDVSHYYLRCNEAKKMNPFQQALQVSREIVLRCTSLSSLDMKSYFSNVAGFSENGDGYRRVSEES